MARIDKKSDAIMLLGIEHERIGQVLDTLERQIDLMGTGKEFDSDLVELAVGYFLTFPDTCHHPKEDLLFKQLLTHGSEDAKIVGDLVRDHAKLSQLTNDANLAVTSGLTASPVDEKALATLRTFLSSYRHHIAIENTSFFPHLLKTLSQDEFDIVDFSLFDRADPVFDQQNEDRFAQLRNEILLKRKEGSIL